MVSPPAWLSTTHPPPIGNKCIIGVLLMMREAFAKRPVVGGGVVWLAVVVRPRRGQGPILGSRLTILDHRKKHYQQSRQCLPPRVDDLFQPNRISRSITKFTFNLFKKFWPKYEVDVALVQNAHRSVVN